ncbi:MAG: SAM-dependent methyltransferase [Saprospiraceae bacterium]|nr:SAM-dependent methyltransferase [Saprospiraceae bacterium]
MTLQNSDFTRFLDKISAKIENSLLFKISLSKPRKPSETLLNIYMKPVEIKGVLMYQLTFRNKTNDFVSNISAEKLCETVSFQLTEHFLNADLISDDEIVTLLTNKKGHSKLLVKKTKTESSISLDHDRHKQRHVPSGRPYLHLLGLADKNGVIYDKAQKKYRQINKYIEIIENLLKDHPTDKAMNIADMGSGKGYLSFALYDYLVYEKKISVQLTGYELRQDMVEKCNKISSDLHFKNLHFVEQNIEQIILPKTDMVIALHACDIATDMAIAKGIDSNADYIVVAPCCHKQIRKDMKDNNELSPILSNGILRERQAELITDGIRALLMEANGYKTQVFEFISTEHTAKNVMITGVKSKARPEAYDEISKIKKLFGIEFHYLEKLLRNG